MVWNWRVLTIHGGTDLHRNPPHIASMEARTHCDDSPSKARNGHRDTPAQMHMHNGNALSSFLSIGFLQASL